MTQHSITVTIPITFSRQDLIDLVEGSGALSWEWWHNVERNEFGWAFTVEAANDAEAEETKHLRFAQIAQALQDYLSENPRDIEFDGYELDFGHFDADIADRVLQTAVFGDVIYG